MTQNYEQRKQLLLMPVREMKQYVADNFEVRHNVITDVYEFRRKTEAKEQETVDNLLPRIASFVGTSNSRQLLYDHTGSRRFLIMEPKEMIRTGGIDYEQLYAQIIHEVETGLPTYFTKAQEREIQRRNQRYMVKDAVETLFFTYFRVPRNKTEGKMITTDEILQIMKSKDEYVVRHLTPDALGQRLVALGFTPRHTRRGSAHRLVAL